ncbi:hypothetical protein K438DRAFT_1977081 [Mycena galopus ATCC 62051]|nr:hypothetical protein K438DRAFT_1977081 [Mycena galopus ATCC 62051]
MQFKAIAFIAALFAIVSVKAQSSACEKICGSETLDCGEGLNLCQLGDCWTCCTGDCPVS